MQRYDLVLVVEDERFPCNRTLLAGASPVFARMLQPDEHGALQREVVLSNYTSDTMRAVLDFLQTGELALCCVDFAVALLEPAQRLLLEQLTDYIEEYLLWHVEPADYCEMFRFAGLRGLCNLKYEFMDRIAEYLRDFSCDSAFPKLEIRLVEEIVHHAAAEISAMPRAERVHFEFELVEAIARWLQPSDVREVYVDEQPPCRLCRHGGKQEFKIVPDVREDGAVPPAATAPASHVENREHYEERLFRQTDLRNFGAEQLMALAEFAEARDFLFLAQYAHDEMRARRACGPPLRHAMAAALA